MSQFPPNTAIGSYYTEIGHKYQLTENRIFYLDLWPFGPSQMVLVSPDAAEHVTATESYPLQDKVRDYLTALLGDEAIGASDSEKWKVLHQMLAPAFRPAKKKNMAGVIASLVVELLHPALETHAESGEVFSMEKCAAQLVFWGQQLGYPRRWCIQASKCPASGGYESYLRVCDDVGADDGGESAGQGGKVVEETQCESAHGAFLQSFVQERKEKPGLVKLSPCRFVLDYTLPMYHHLQN
jgi:hypothetical protein